MDNNSSKSSTVDAKEVRRLVTSAEATGEPDSYTGKRHAMRIAEGMQLEVTDDSSKPASTMAVTMHNVSDGGCAFWCKKKLELRSRVLLREFSADNSLPWLPGHVTHCTAGIRGFLIGVAFGDRASGK